MSLLNIVSAAATNLTPINEFGQNPAHNEFNVWVSFLLLFLWPLLIFISYKFISYTMRKLEEGDYFNDIVEEVAAPEASKEAEATTT